VPRHDPLDAAGGLTGLDPIYLAAKEKLAAMFPPGHWELFQMALDLAQAGALTPLNRNERKIIRQIAGEARPIFP
jgi:hypothetical protein